MAITKYINLSNHRPIKFSRHLLLLLLAGMTTNVLALEVTGTLRFKGSDARTANIADAIIYFVPNDPTQVTVTADEYKITMARKQFVPRTLAVGVGSTINIPNDDSISHNAFSPSSPSNFDLDLYSRGQSKSFTVKGPGVIRIYCNVHYHMVAYVLGLDTPYHTRADSKGNFSMEVPDVPGKIVVWHERTSDYSQEIIPGQRNIVDTSLAITKRRLPMHNNKFGGSYRRAR